jgi:small nuclear ribonucleoprotein (snRNP)-like protein
MAAFDKFEIFVEDLTNTVHDLFGTDDTLNVYLSNAVIDLTSDVVLADVAEIATGNGYTGPQDTANSGARASGTFTLQGTSIRITATGTIGPFQHIVLYNDTPTSPLDPLIGKWSRASALTLEDGDTFDILFDGATVSSPGDIFTIA